MKRALAIGLALVLAACGTARTLVLDPVRSAGRFTRVELVENNPTVKVPAEVTATFRSVIEKGLYEKNVFARGPDLRILYTFVSNNPGNQFTRWFWGGMGNSGEGSLIVTVRYLDSNGLELAKTQVEGRIGSGFLGGTFDDAVTKAGEDVVKFTMENFSSR